MKLFEEVKNKIIVTEYLTDNDKAKVFKRKEIQKIPETERILSVETNANLSIKVGCNKVNFSDLLYYEKDGFYHIIQGSQLTKNEQNRIIENYCNISLDDGIYEPYIIENPYERDTVTNVARTRIDNAYYIKKDDREVLKKLKYFLTFCGYKVDNYPHLKVYMDRIINSTEGLYLYHLLLRNEFSELNNKDIEEQVSLFKPSRCMAEFDIKELIKNQINLKTVGIITNNTETYYDKLMVKVKESEPILKLIKK